MTFQKALVWTVLTISVLVFAVYVSSHPMDFRVYHYGARGVFDGTRPVYGPSSGLGWPMHYRYPPLFLLLFTPFALLPLGLSAALWMVAKAIVLVLLVRSIIRRLPPSARRHEWWIPALLAGPYVIQDFRYGNAQFFVFALTVASLLLIGERPIVSAALLALAISLKVWPAFFVPVLIVRAMKPARTFGAIALFSLILALAPSFYFGVSGNAHLLHQWFDQEFRTQTGQEEIWFPSQSLRGVMMRYLTDMDYSQVPDSNYPEINLTQVTPAAVRTVWILVALAIYAFYVATVRSTDKWVAISLGFCLIGLLQPFTQKYALVILLFPALVIGRFFDKLGRIRLLVFASIALVWLQIVIPGAMNQRWLQVLGFDFAATAAIALSLTFFSCNIGRHDPRSETTGTKPLRADRRQGP